jgi:hypothetical protein
VGSSKLTVQLEQLHEEPHEQEPEVTQAQDEPEELQLQSPIVDWLRMV